MSNAPDAAAALAELLTPQEVATALRITDRTVLNHISSGALDAVRVGRQWRVPRAALQAFAPLKGHDPMIQTRPQHHDVSSFTSRDIDAVIRENEAIELAEREKSRLATLAEKDELAEREKAIGAARSELAQDLGCSRDGLSTALAMRRSRSPYALLWDALGRLLWSDPAAFDLDAVRGSRHALAYAEELPPVRRDDKSFGSTKALRDLPKPAIEANPRLDAIWLEPLTRALGIATPRLAEPACESINDAYERTQHLHDAKKYDPKDERRSAALRDRDLEIAADRYRAEKAKAHAAYLADMSDLRTRLRDALDVALNERDVDPAWGYAREVRRHVAGEPRRLTSDMAQTWHQATSLGFRVALRNAA